MGPLRSSNSASRCRLTAAQSIVKSCATRSRPRMRARRRRACDASNARACAPPWDAWPCSRCAIRGLLAGACFVQRASWAWIWMSRPDLDSVHDGIIGHVVQALPKLACPDPSLGATNLDKTTGRAGHRVVHEIDREGVFREAPVQRRGALHLHVRDSAGSWECRRISAGPTRRRTLRPARVTAVSTGDERPAWPVLKGPPPRRLLCAVAPPRLGSARHEIRDQLLRHAPIADVARRRLGRRDDLRVGSIAMWPLYPSNPRAAVLWP